MFEAWLSKILPMGWRTKFDYWLVKFFPSPPFLTASGAHPYSYPKSNRGSFHRGRVAEYQKVGSHPFAFVVQA